MMLDAYARSLMIHMLVTLGLTGFASGGILGAFALTVMGHANSFAAPVAAFCLAVALLSAASLASAHRIYWQLHTPALSPTVNNC